MPTMANFISPTITTTMNYSSHQNHHLPSWPDEFLDFSSTRRGAHRRSTSDSVTFLDQPLVGESRAVNAMTTETNMFDAIDDAQLKSMFSKGVPLPVAAVTAMSNSNPSTPPTSDQNSPNDEKPTQGEVESYCKSLETQASEPPSSSNGGDSIIDPKRVKRILANRQSAQRSRVKKLQYISELERSVTTLQTEVSGLTPKVAFLDHQRVTVENSTLKQRIAALAQDKIFKDAQQEGLKKEIERLTQLYQHQQNIQQINTNHHHHHPPPQQQQQQLPWNGEQQLII